MSMEIEQQDHGDGSRTGYARFDQGGFGYLTGITRVMNTTGRQERVRVTVEVER